ncbi:MAG TPA: PQQ-binding-like beta-propeller repeat protein [Gemmataceae bacterium]
MSIFTLRAGLVFTASLGAMPVLSADWPTVHGNADRNGFTTDCVRGPYRLDWVAEFPNEILATRVEAIVADGKVFLGTLNGTLWALDRHTGRVLWKHGGNGSVQHSPAYADSRVFYGDTSGLLWALDAATGKVIWKFRAGKGGFVTTPLVANRTVYLGSRDGTFYALTQDTGRPRWLFATSGPIRCSAAQTGSQILFASDDMHAYSLDAASGRQKWKSEKLYGQSFRDYYPVVLGDKAVFRSVLVEEMNDDLNGGTAFLQQRAGIPGGWKELDAFFKSDRNRGTPELLRDEQEAILKRLADNPFRRTSFILDLNSGKESVRAPLLYLAGNQGCGIPPVRVAEGKTVVSYRTVYSNWNLGVKPAVGLGFLDLKDGWITPLRHGRGNTPPWNTFWGTADETTNFSVGGDLLYITHQGTLSALDLKSKNLFPIHGNRDTWGGLLTPVWAANEWHGPARGAVAISDHQLFWVTGSRVLCLRGGAKEVPTSPRSNTPERKQTGTAFKASTGVPEASRLIAEVSHVENIPQARGKGLRAELAREVKELLDGWPWAPFYLQMGIGSRDFYFAHPAYALQALALAWPYLPKELANQARARAREELSASIQAEALPLNAGRRRELYKVPPHDLSWSYHPRWPALGHIHAVWLYGERTGDWQAVEALWPRVQEVWRRYSARPLAPDARQGGHLYLNRTAAGCLAYARLARRFKADKDATAATRELDRLLHLMLSTYRIRAAIAAETLQRTNSRGDIQDNQGRKLYFHLNNHKSKLALFLDLTPELGRALAAAAPAETAVLNRWVDQLMPAFYLAFEERSVHYGENFVDLPDSVHGLFLAKAFLWNAPADQLARYTDVPWVRADLFHIEKLVHAIEAAGQQKWEKR